MTSRRRFLRDCVALSSAVVLAGCADESGENVGGDGDGENGGETPAIEAYRDRLERELEITITTLEERDGGVVLEYVSQREVDTAEWGYEVGFISERFARLVNDGWEVERLSATVTGGEGRTMAWDLDAETAREYVADEITTDEFVNRIFGSMEEQ